MDFLKIDSFAIYLLPISFIIFLILSFNARFRFISTINKRLKSFKEKNVQDDETEKKYKKLKCNWIWKAIGGNFGLCIAIYFTAIIIKSILTDTDINIPVILLPFTIFGLIYFSYLYFFAEPGINKLVNYWIEESIDLYLNILLPSARKTIKIYSGNLRPDFYGDDRIIKSLEILKGEGVEIEILFSYPENNGNKKEVIDLIEEKLKYLEDCLFALTAVPKFKTHFVVIDNSHVRLEQVHKPFYEEKEKRIGHKGWIYLFDYPLAFDLRKKFKNMKSIAEKVEVNNG